MNEAVADTLRQALAGRTDVRLAILFGSTARGTDRADSDVDVAVLGRDLDQLALATELTRAVRREVQIVDLDAVGFPMLQAIVRDGVVVAEHEGVYGAVALARAGGPGERPSLVRAHARRVPRPSGRGPSRMTNRDVVTAKLAELEDRLGRVRANVRATASELASDRDATHGVLDLERFAREVAAWIARRPT